MNHNYFENLSPEEKRVIVDKGTEAPFTGEYDNFYEVGIFVCRACGSHLYDSSINLMLVVVGQLLTRLKTGR